MESTTTAREWTIMLYMAADNHSAYDNDFGTRCVDDLRKLQLARLTPGVVDVLALVARKEHTIPTKVVHFPSNATRPKGPSLFKVNDLKDALGLVRKLAAQETPLSHYLHSQLAPLTRMMMASVLPIFARPEVSETAKEIFGNLINKLIADLNELLKDSSLYDPNRFEQVALRCQTKQMLAQTRTEDELTYRNRLLLEDAYALEITKNRQQFVLEVLPTEQGETNTGKPETLQNFISKCIDGYPARKYMLILWGQAGILNSETVQAKDKKAFFTFCNDERSGDGLNNRELKKVLRNISKTKLGGRKLDILAMDTCLMSQLEMCYEVRDYVNYTIGAETYEPGLSWPYDFMLSRLNEDPQMSPEAFCRLAVNQYVEFYLQYSASNVQISACDLNRLDPLLKALNELTVELIKFSTALWLKGAVAETLSIVQTFARRQYIDLYDFCEVLDNSLDPQRTVSFTDKVPQKTIKAIRNRESGMSDLSDAEAATRDRIRKGCRAVMAAIDSNSATDAAPDPGFVIANDFLANALSTLGVEQSFGLSIYFPTQNCSPQYFSCDFAKDSEWGDWLRLYHDPFRTMRGRMQNINNGTPQGRYFGHDTEGA